MLIIVLFINTACTEGTYGLDCKGMCGYCQDKTHCYHVNGSCLYGCSQGYFGEMCKTCTYFL